MIRRTHNKVNKLHVKRGDTVKVLSGDDKGATGRVLEVYPKKMTALVEGVNMCVKHVRATQGGNAGQRLEREAPIRTCKLMVVDPKTNQATRIGRSYDEKEQKWVRVAKKSGAIIP